MNPTKTNVNETSNYFHKFQFGSDLTAYFVLGRIEMQQCSDQHRWFIWIDSVPDL